MLDLLHKVTAAQLKLAYRAQIKELMGYAELTKRLERAYDMLTRDSNYEIKCIRQKGKPISFDVKSPNDTYGVTPSAKSCTCPSYEGGSKLCKHRIAINLLIQASKIKIGE